MSVKTEAASLPSVSRTTGEELAAASM